MPSLVVHLALAGLLAAGLLGSAFDRRSLFVVLVAVLFADTDVFLGFVIRGAHRAAFHTLLLPFGAAALLYYDTRVREVSWLRERFGPTAARVAAVTIGAYAFAAIGLDFVTGGANVFYPIHDDFYYLNGRLILSNHRGLVQTFVHLDHGSFSANSVGTTHTVHMGSGFDPSAGREPRNVERIFPVVGAGWQLLLVVTSIVVVGARLWEADRSVTNE